MVWSSINGVPASASSFPSLVTFDAQYYSPMYDHAAAGTDEDINWNDSNEHRVLLDENVTFTFSNPVHGGRYVVVLVQDGTGGNTVTWPASVIWAGGTAPVITADANAVSLCTFMYDSNTSKYLGAYNLDLR